MLKKEYAESLDLAEQFSKILLGKTYITSRHKLKGRNGRYYSNKQNSNFYFLTLHSLVTKILPREATNYCERLAGSQMKINVEQAVVKVLGNVNPDNELVMKYYIAIREYDENIENYEVNPYSQSIATLECGMDIYQAYTQLKNGHLDWEDSMLLGSYYLNYNLINSTSLEAKSIILVNTECLLEKGNKNCANFIISLVKWSKKYTNLNFYFITKDKKVTPFINGQQLDPINILDLISCVQLN